MATKAELIEFAQDNGIGGVDESMLKADIEARIEQAGYDPVSLEAIDEEEPMSDEPAAPEPEEAPSEDFDPEVAQERGWWGVRPHEIDDAEYSLTTGPDSPTGNMVAGGVTLLEAE